MRASEQVRDSTPRAELLSALLRHLRDQYVFPDVAVEIESALRLHAGRGRYDQAGSGGELAERLTADLQAVARDKHLRVRYSPTPLPSEGEGTPADPDGQRQSMLLDNGGFCRVERLPGNLGYLDLRAFADPEVAAGTAVAAMALVAHTSGLIIDLRQNGGGSPAMVALLCSYLLEGHVHLNSIYWRGADRTDQYWTLPYVPGHRYLGRPVWVLTGRRTFSAAEEFAYNLKQLQRATLVGAVTAGGAHPGAWFRLSPHFAAFIPTGRAINPITGTNWEGTGVVPDVVVPEEQALPTAYAAALRHVLAGARGHPGQDLAALAEQAEQALAGLAAD